MERRGNSIVQLNRRFVKHFSRIPPRRLPVVLPSSARPTSVVGQRPTPRAFRVCVRAYVCMRTTTAVVRFVEMPPYNHRSQTQQRPPLTVVREATTATFPNDYYYYNSRAHKQKKIIIGFRVRRMSCNGGRARVD